MDRRTFFLLTGAASAAFTRRFDHPAARPSRGREAPGPGRLRFELDDQRRWSLFYQSEGAAVPLIRGATLGARIADRLVTLADLEYSTLGTRRPPGGEALIVRGRASGVFLEAEFLSAGDSAAPLAVVSLRVYPDRSLPTVGGVRFLQAAESAVLPGDGTLWALVNGYDSWTEDRVIAVSGRADMPMVASEGALGLTRGGRGLGLAFEADAPGRGRVRLASDGLDAACDWVPGRPLRSDGDASALRLCYQPFGDGLTALRALFVPTSPVDQERLQAAPAPAGWCSWYELRDRVTEADVVAHVELCAGQFDRRFFHYIQLDQGYERAAGDWDANDKFPHGHRWLTNQIHAKGLQAGLWLAPFAVAEPSGLAAAHPDWLLKNADGSAPIVWATRDDWGGRVYALDGAHPGVQQWLGDLARRAVEQWGYDYLKLDFLAWATGESTHYGGLTHAEAYRLGLGALRDGAGPDTFLLGAGAPLQHSAGLVNGMRIGPNIDADWSALRASAQCAALRDFYHRGVWLNDPDCLLVRAPLSPAEAQLRATIVALTGGLTFFADDLTKLPAERLAWLARVLPPTPVAGQPVGAAAGEAAAGGRPADTWLAEGAPRWWTAALVNWDDEARTVTVPLRTLGLTGKRFAAYNVWRDTPLPDLTDTITATLDPHSGLTLGIRPASASPQVIGTTRHVVQGAVDIANETWDASTRTLKGRSTNLDARPYAITIALPRSLRVGACKADVPCHVRTLDTGHAVLEWEAGDGRDIAWELSFRSVRKR